VRIGGETDLHVIEAILHDTPRPLGDEIPPALRTVVEKALEKDPADRYQSMRDLVVDLRRLVRHTGEVPSAIRPSTRRIPWAAIGAIATLLLVTGATAAWWRGVSLPGSSAAGRLVAARPVSAEAYDLYMLGPLSLLAEQPRQLEASDRRTREGGPAAAGLRARPRHAGAGVGTGSQHGVHPV
jgi:hypothetical protein